MTMVAIGAVVAGGASIYSANKQSKAIKQNAASVEASNEENLAMLNGLLGGNPLAEGAELSMELLPELLAMQNQQAELAAERGLRYAPQYTQSLLDSARTMGVDVPAEYSAVSGDAGYIRKMAKGLHDTSMRRAGDREAQGDYLWNQGLTTQAGGWFDTSLGKEHLASQMRNLAPYLSVRGRDQYYGDGTPDRADAMTQTQFLQSFEAERDRGIAQQQSALPWLQQSDTVNREGWYLPGQLRSQAAAIGLQLTGQSLGVAQAAHSLPMGAASAAMGSSAGMIGSALPTPGMALGQYGQQLGAVQSILGANAGGMSTLAGQQQQSNAQLQQALMGLGTTAASVYGAGGWGSSAGSSSGGYSQSPYVNQTPSWESSSSPLM